MRLFIVLRFSLLNPEYKTLVNLKASTHAQPKEYVLGNWTLSVCKRGMRYTRLITVSSDKGITYAAIICLYFPNI